jgi:Putative transmembrane protein (PGPGW)
MAHSEPDEIREQVEQRLHRHDVWGDDPEERDASAVVAEFEHTDPNLARRWHQRPFFVPFKVVGRFIGRNAKRVAVTIAGFALLLLGVIGLFLPVLQGWLFIILGLVVLSTEYVWARRLLEKARAKAEQAKDALAQRKSVKAARKAERRGDAVSGDDMA